MNVCQLSCPNIVTMASSNLIYYILNNSPSHGEIYQQYKYKYKYNSFARFYSLAELFVVFERNSGVVDEISITPALDGLTMKNGGIPADLKRNIDVKNKAKNNLYLFYCIFATHPCCQIKKSRFLSAQPE